MANEFCAIADVKTFLGITDTNSDAVLTALCTLVSGMMRTYLSRDIYPVTSYTANVDGNGKTSIILPEYPITAVSSLSIDGTDIPARTSPTGSGYTFNRNTVTLSGYEFSKGAQNVSIAYSAGYAAIPDEIKSSAVIWVATLFQRRKNLDITSRAIGAENVAYANDACPKSASLILDQWKAVVPYARG